MLNIQAPKYPYVQFESVKLHRSHENMTGIESKDVGFLRVDGCHNSVESLSNLERSGKRITGHGNLVPAKHKEIMRYLDMRLGHNVHPLMRESVMDQKVEKMTKLAKEAKPNA